MAPDRTISPLLLLAAVSATLVLLAILPSAGPDPTYAQGVQGDTDCSEVVDIVDALQIQRFAAGMEKAKCIDTAGDVNCDKAVDVLDSLGLLRYVAGFPPLPTPSGCPEIGAGLATPTPVLTPSPVPPPENGFRLVKTAAGITEPNMLDLAFAPGSKDEAIVATQTGQLWRVSLSGAFGPEPFGDITDRMTRVSDEGLLGMTFAPGDPTTLYLNYTTGGVAQYWGNRRAGCSAKEWAPLPHDDPKRNRISRFTVADDELDLDSEEVIFDVPQPHCWHNVSDLVFGPDGYLYIGVGDGGWIGGYYDGAADTDDIYATILRIDVSSGEPGYTVPPDNPFVDGPGGNVDEIFAYGLRHAWRFSFDPLTGELWATDTGEHDWEEVDHVVAGGNYGWNTWEGNHCYPPWDTTCDEPDGYVAPRAEYQHGDEGCAGTGGFVYRGSALPELDGWYIYGDFCTVKVWAVHPHTDGPPVLLLDGAVCESACLTSFAETPDGEILAITAPRNDDPGAIYQLERAP